MATTNEAKELIQDARTRTGSEPITGSESRRVIARYPDHAAAERAVDWLSDQGFAVEHVAIVGQGLRSDEFQIVGRSMIFRILAVGRPAETAHGEIEARRAVLSLIVPVGDEVGDLVG